MKNKMKRKIRVRKRINPLGRPRLSVFRSGKHIYAQIIDDGKRKTLISASDNQPGKSLKEVKMTKIQKAKEVGEIIAQKAAKIKITDVVFDRGSYKYHGRVKALAEGAREGGLKF